MILKTALLLISFSMAFGQGVPPPPPPDLTGIPGEDPTIPIGGTSVPNPFANMDSSTEIVFTPELRQTMKEFGITEPKLREMLEEQKRTGKPTTLSVMEDGVEKTITWDFSQLQSAGATIDDATLKKLQEIGVGPLPSTQTQLPTSSSSASVSSTTTTVTRPSPSTTKLQETAQSGGLQAVLGGSESRIITETRPSQISGTSSRISGPFPLPTSQSGHSHDDHSIIPVGSDRRLSGSTSTGFGAVRGDGVGVVDIDTDINVPRGIGPTPLVSQTIQDMINKINKMRRSLFERQSFLTEEQYRTEMEKINQEERKLMDMQQRTQPIPRQRVQGIPGPIRRAGPISGITGPDPFFPDVPDRVAGPPGLVPRPNIPMAARRVQTRQVTTGPLTPGRSSQSLGNMISAEEQRRIQDRRAMLREQYNSLQEEMLRYEEALRTSEAGPTVNRGINRNIPRRPLRRISGVRPTDFRDTIEGRPIGMVRTVAGQSLTSMPLPPTMGRIRGPTRRTIRGSSMPFSDGDITITPPVYDGMFDGLRPRVLSTTRTEPYVLGRGTSRPYIYRYMRPMPGFTRSTSGMVVPWYRRQRFIRTTDTNPPFISGAQSINFFPSQMPRRSRIVF